MIQRGRVSSAGIRLAPALRVSDRRRNVPICGNHSSINFSPGTSPVKVNLALPASGTEPWMRPSTARSTAVAPESGTISPVMVVVLLRKARRTPAGMAARSCSASGGNRSRCVCGNRHGITQSSACSKEMAPGQDRRSSFGRIIYSNLRSCPQATAMVGALPPDSKYPLSILGEGAGDRERRCDSAEGGTRTHTRGYLTTP